MYFKIIPIPDFNNPDKELQKKTKYYKIEIGYNCSNSCVCDCRDKCRYNAKYTWHNFIVSIRRFFYRKFNIELGRLPFYFERHYTDLSGTTTCPFKKERMYSCIHCSYHAGFDEYMKGLCSNKERTDSTWKDTQHPSQPVVCKYFKKNNFADNYDKKTGDMIF